jgi:protein SPA2
MRTLQNELEALREEQAREKDMAARRARQDEEELQILRERLETGGGGNVNDSNAFFVQSADAWDSLQADPEILDQLRSDMEGLLTELTDLSKRNDELMTAKDADLVVIRDLDTQLKEYKRKYEQAKTELRSMKGKFNRLSDMNPSDTLRLYAATSQLFLQAPKTEDQLPVSPDGGLLDIHVTAFVSSIDSLLTAGRSNAPTRVLTPMKSVVNAVTAIIEDVRTFERRPARDRAEVNLEALHALRERAEATLSNLVAAAKTHATSAGMAPVSLLDAAASHVSLTITEIGKTVCIRKATKTEQDRFTPASPPPTVLPSSVANALRSMEHQRRGSNSSVRSTSDRLAELASSPSRSMFGRTSLEEGIGALSEPSSSPSMFDSQGLSSANVTGDESTSMEGTEDAWAELKVCVNLRVPRYDADTLGRHISKRRPRPSYSQSRASCRPFVVPCHHRLWMRTSPKLSPLFRASSLSARTTSLQPLRSKERKSCGSSATTPTPSAKCRHFLRSPKSLVRLWPSRVSP